MTTVHFLLVPDRAASRRVRRELATDHARLGVVVGTWPELIDLAHGAYAVPDAPKRWRDKLAEAMYALPDAFWARSLRAAPAETVAVVETALGDLIESLPPGDTIVVPSSAATGSSGEERNTGGSGRDADGEGRDTDGVERNSAGVERDSDGVARNSEGVERATASDQRDRAGRHVNDLGRLRERLAEALPPRLAEMQRILDAPADRLVRGIIVQCNDGAPPLTPWQKALVEKLTRDAEAARTPRAQRAQDPSGPSAQDRSAQLAPDQADQPAQTDGSGAADRPDALGSSLDAALLNALDQQPEAPQGTALGRLQRQLFSSDSSPGPLDDTVQFLAARDYLEEIEVAAGMVQRAVQEEPGLRPADFGLLLPGDPLYARAAADVFEHVGLPLAGLNAQPELRDVGREAVLLFLQTRRESARSMALASLYALPVMPWSRRLGLSMAQRVVDYRHRFDPPDELIDVGTRMVGVIQDRPETQDELAEALTLFVSLLTPQHDLDRAVETARDLAEAVVAELDGDEALTPEDWRRLEMLAMPAEVHGESVAVSWRDGVAVVGEHEEPWRPVKRLIVVGFASGRFPKPPATSAVFADDDIEWLRESMGVEMATGDDKLARRRMLLRRQLSAASEQLTVLLPRRDTLGEPEQESATLTFMSELFNQSGPRSFRVVDLSMIDGMGEAVGVAVAGAAPVSPPRALATGDLHLGRDLLELPRLTDGRRRSQSPTSLENLMVSPLAWLLERSGIEPRTWAPDDADPLTRGSLAHDVFEHLFVPGELPRANEIGRQVDRLLADVARKTAPFLLGRAWRVERLNLMSEIVRAAERWLAILTQIDARVVATERYLFGRYDGAKLVGKVDAVIALPGDVVYVVDYKKSSSGKRLERMEKGFDHQASLYRLMLETGTSSGDDDRLRRVLSGAQTTGVLYFTMNDNAVLADTGAGGLGRVAGAEVLDRDISGGAMELIRERIEEVRTGVIRMNHVGDDKRMARMGLPTYALERGPLIPLLALPEEEAGS